MEYDSSLMNSDYLPTRARLNDEVKLGEPIRYGLETDLIEMPISWALDDFPHFEFIRTPEMTLPGLNAPRAVMDAWWDEFVYMQKTVEWGVLTYTMHPYVIGRGNRMLALAFTDGRKKARGLAKAMRNTPTIVGAAYSPWQFWDGRKDSLWSQALGPFENPKEHGVTRAWVVWLVSRDAGYRRRYEALFGPLPLMTDAAGLDAAFVNLGKAIAAYERAIMPAPAKFDRYVAAVLAGRAPAPADQFTIEEIAGLRVFISDNQGQCIRCHNGPMFTDNHFHNIGSQMVGADADEQGRRQGIKAALADATNCQGAFSDAPGLGCAELRFAKRAGPELAGAFKTPTLRNLARTAPYMHAGQFQTLEDVIWQYRDVPRATVGEIELTRLPMSDAQFRQIEDFLRTLDGPIRAPERFLRPPE